MIEINTPSDFGIVLDITIAEVEALVAAEPTYTVWQVVTMQLHLMKAWDTSALHPSQDEKGFVSLGLIAARALEPTSKPWPKDLTDRLFLLSNYWWDLPNGPFVRNHNPSRAVRNSIIITLLVGVWGLFLLTLLNLLP